MAPCRTSTKKKDAPNLGASGSSGRTQPPRQAMLKPVILDLTSSAEEEAASPPGKYPSPPAGNANRVGSVLGQKCKADLSTPKAKKLVRVATATVDLEEELAEASRLLEGVWDEAVEAEQRVRAVEARVRDVEGWVQDLRKRVKEGK